MRVIHKAPGCLPEFRDIPNTLEALQEAVGGYIETFTFATDAAVVCNEEGHILGLPYNCDLLGIPFCGPILIVGVNGDEFCDIPADLQKLFGCLDRVER